MINTLSAFAMSQTDVMESLELAVKAKHCSDHLLDQLVGFPTTENSGSGKGFVLKYYC